MITSASVWETQEVYHPPVHWPVHHRWAHPQVKDSRIWLAMFRITRCLTFQWSLRSSNNLNRDRRYLFFWIGNRYRYERPRKTFVHHSLLRKLNSIEHTWQVIRRQASQAGVIYRMVLQRRIHYWPNHEVLEPVLGQQRAELRQLDLIVNAVAITFRIRYTSVGTTVGNLLLFF